MVVVSSTALTSRGALEGRPMSARMVEIHSGYCCKIFEAEALSL